MKTMSRITGIISVSLCILCVIPSIIGMFSGTSLTSDEELVYRAIAYILFELFIFVGGIIFIVLSSKPAANIFASALLIIAGILQINFNAGFSLVFIGSLSLLLLSWTAVISVILGLIIFIFSINKIIKLKKTNKTNVKQEDELKTKHDVDCCISRSCEKCINCGVDIPNNIKFCPECGYKIASINDTIKSDDTVKSETNITEKKNGKIKTIVIATGVVLTILVVGTFVSSTIFDNSALPTKANEAELKLINYIIENGSYDKGDKEYTVSEITNEAGIDFSYSITYNTETKKLTFRDTSLISSGMTITTMNYEYGAEKQSVSITTVISGGQGISSQGVIYPATYTSSNRTIYSFESSYDYTGMKSVCETSVYQMLIHCQLIMIDADTGMVPFGFEKGLFK